MGPTLQRIILHKLGAQPLSGYSLAKEIEHSTGQRPSYGSIYPILEKMANDGLVTAEQQGRKKIYTLTQAGKAAMKAHKEQRQAIIENIIRQHRTFCEIAGEDATPIISLLERLKKGEQPFGTSSAAALRMRNLLFKMAADGTAERHAKELNIILNDTIKKLEKIHEKA